MKKIFLYALTAVLALGSVSCKDDEVMGVVNPAEEFDRMPMTMFRLNENTDKGDNDPFGMRVITEERNTAMLVWYGVKGCAGYEIKYGLTSGLTSGLAEDWDNPDNLTDHVVIDDPEQLTLRIPDLEYGEAYRFAIRVLNPDGIEEHHSKWYGYGNGREWAEQAGLTMEPRYDTPELVSIQDVAADCSYFTVKVNINAADAIHEAVKGEKPGDQNKKSDALWETYKEYFDRVQDGNQDDRTKALFKVTKLTVKPAKDNPSATIDGKWSDYTIQQSDFTDGIATYKVSGLMPNAKYVVEVLDDNPDKAYVDQRYNAILKPVYGIPGDPIIIEHKVVPNDRVPGAVEFEACPLDTIIGNFGSDTNLAEGQVFQLEGGKAYYFFRNPDLAKGFTLETKPEDLAQGKRAIVYLGGMGNGLDDFGNETATLGTCNFMFGRQKAGGEPDCLIEVGDIIFRNIDFDCPKALNYGHQQEGEGSATGNYFANMYSNGMKVRIKSLQVLNCSFQRMVRGFIRVQGTKQKVFDKMLIKGNMFYNCGYYDNNGRGYAWIAGDGASTISNIYTDFEFSNNTMYDCPRTCFINDNDKNIEYTNEVKWNIRINNNTFINYSTRSKDRNIFQIRYVPGDSHIEFRNNLLVVTKADNDKRAVYQGGSDIREIKGSGRITYRIDNNYIAGSKTLSDGKFFESYRFSLNKNSFGAFPQFNLGTADDLEVKTGTPALKATELFNSPNPPYTEHNTSKANHRDHEAPADIWNALKYKQDPAIQGHDIVKFGIGDPRWNTADPKHFYDNL